jgi:hypothetical protein
MELQIELHHITADAANALLLSVKYFKYSTDFIITVKETHGFKVFTKEKVGDTDHRPAHSHQRSLRLLAKTRV